MAAGAKMNPRVLNLEKALDLSSAAVNDAAKVADSEYRAQEVKLFATEGASGGPPWQQLSPRYRAWKSKKFPGRRILTRTGDMRDALATKTSPKHLVNVFRVSKWRIQLGAQGPAWWAYHARGGRIAGRPPVRNQQQRTPELDARLAEAVRRGLAPHVLRNLRIRLAASKVA